MSGVAKPDLADYFARARSLEGERLVLAERSRTTWRNIAIGACGLSGVLGLAVCLLMPLKSVELQLWKVNATTGTVEQVTPMRGPQTWDEGVNKATLADYVRCREGFMFDDAQRCFRKVNLMSVEGEQSRFSEGYSIKNPKSALALLGRDGRARIEFKSISFPSPNVGFVRFTKTIERRSSDTVVLSLVATVAFDSNLAPMTDDDRLLNPLGFTVRDYRLDTETP